MMSAGPHTFGKKSSTTRDLESLSFSPKETRREERGMLRWREPLHARKLLTGFPVIVDVFSSERSILSIIH